MDKLAQTLVFSLIVASIVLSMPHTVKAYTYYYSITGPIDEDTEVLSPLIDVNVTVYFAGAASETFNLTAGNVEYAPAQRPSYFDFNLGYIRRQYWTSIDENEGFIDVYNATDLQNVTIQFQDFSGILDTNFRCEVYNAERLYDHIVEKQVVDSARKCGFHLKPGKAYDFKLRDGNGAVYDYGNVVILSNLITLVVRGIDFPLDVVMAYQYVQVYGFRDFSTPTGSIMIQYNDTLGLTSQFTYTIYLNNETVVLPTQTFTGESTIVSTWLGATNSTDYIVRATITHSQFGVMTWNHYFPREFSSPPFSLDWMGTWPVTSSAVIPAFLILFAFGSFSVLNAYIGVFFGMVTATLISYWGWLVIPTPMLVLGWVLAFLCGIAANKRRLFT